MLLAEPGNITTSLTCKPSFMSNPRTEKDENPEMGQRAALSMSEKT